MMHNRFDAYKEITQDYLDYFIQHKAKLSGQSAQDQKPAPLSALRNALTGTFYNGKHARFIVWDMLAGHAKNNFLFNLVKKPPYANYIALIDRIVKLDNLPTGILEALNKATAENNTRVLLDCFFNYFIKLQNGAVKKDAAYFRNMKALQKDIHDLARQESVTKRIVKNRVGGDRYEYALQEIPDDQATARENQKDQTRLFKSRWKAAVKVMAVGMGITEIFIGLAALTTIGIGMLAFQIVVASSALYFGYIFAKDELFELGKEIYLGRIFKIKNQQTGEYESLKTYQIVLIMLLSPLALVAGVCWGVLAFTSVLAALGAGSIPLIAVVSLFVLCLSTATFFLTIKKIISHITVEQLLAYGKSLLWQDNESGFKYAARLGLEMMKWAVVLGVMGFVAVGGYYLFKDKLITVLKTLWSKLSLATVDGIAEAISFCYSAIKAPFGVKKIMQLVDSALDKLQSAIDAVVHFFSSKPVPEKEELLTKLPPPLNPLQEQNQLADTCYSSTFLVLAIIRGGVMGGLYHKAAITHDFSHPEITGETAGTFVASIYANSFLAGQEKQTVTPIPSRL